MFSFRSEPYKAVDFLGDAYSVLVALFAVVGAYNSFSPAESPPMVISCLFSAVALGVNIYKDSDRPKVLAAKGIILILVYVLFRLAYPTVSIFIDNLLLFSLGSMAFFVSSMFVALINIFQLGRIARNHREGKRL